MVKILYENTEFVYYTSLYEGYEISFRRNKTSDKIEIRFDENFAKAHGYESLSKMAVECLGSCTYIPDWLEVAEDGSFVFHAPLTPTGMA